MGKRFQCHKISEGKATGQAIISKDNIMFYLINPENGVFIEPGHDLEGKSISQKILIFPGGKGSAVVQADGIYQLMMKNNHPRAMLIQFPETVLVASAIIMEIPMVDKISPDFYETVKDGDTLFVNADEGYIEICE